MSNIRFHKILLLVKIRVIFFFFRPIRKKTDPNDFQLSSNWTYLFFSIALTEIV